MNADAGSTVPSGAGPAACPDCLCMGLGPQLTTLVRTLVSTTGVGETMRNTELDVLKFLKSVIDQRIAGLSGPAAETRGTSVVID